MHDSGKRLTILTVKEIQALYGLPHFTDEERATYFALDPLEKQQLDFDFPLAGIDFSLLSHINPDWME